ncbi:MAG: diguanylate cyclase [Lachnospiraceae bacterium]|nr:diguanylate cyclase [Lachnospiraceae bacterium]
MKRIFMVDDEPVNLECAAQILNDSYEVMTARSGKQGLIQLEKSIPDLILLDINMPGMNGYEVMDELKKNQVLKDIPVIFLSSHMDGESEIKGLKMGAMDCIRKPFEPEIVRSRIDKILKMTEQKKELQDIALKDGLTDLLNRRYMEKLLNQTETDGKKGFFMLLDLDNFKLVNDIFGHKVGDDVLVRFARVMEKQVGDENSVCRLGGDEFAVYFSGNHKKKDIISFAQNMIAGIEYEINELLLDSGDFNVSVSIGIAQKPEDGQGFTKLYSAADKALYFVKQNGKRGYHFFSDTAVEAKEREEERRQINLRQLQRLMLEQGRESGAYRVEYAGFKWIYHLIFQCIKKKNYSAHLLLFTVHDKAGDELEKSRAVKGIEALEQAVSKSLSGRDAATKCGRVQYVALLPDTSPEEGKMIACRVQEKFQELLEDDTMELSYEMESIAENT